MSWRSAPSTPTSIGQATRISTSTTVRLAKPASTGTILSGVLDLDEMEDAVAEAAKAGLYSSRAFPRTGDQIKSYATVDDAATDDVDESEQSTFPGTFHGVPGEYSCTNNNQPCTATSDKDGVLMTLTGMWEFERDDQPEGSPFKVFGVIEDADHVHFGYWLQTTPGVDDEPTTNNIQTFYGGNAEYTMNAQLEGTANYNGRAAGHYVRKTLKPNGDLASAVTGEFQAEADLTASFGGMDVAVSRAYSVMGTISDFEGNDGTDLSGWELALQRTKFGRRRGLRVHRRGEHGRQRRNLGSPILRSETRTPTAPGLPRAALPASSTATSTTGTLPAASAPGWWKSRPTDGSGFLA